MFLGSLRGGDDPTFVSCYQRVSYRVCHGAECDDPTFVACYQRVSVILGSYIGILCFEEMKIYMCSIWVIRYRDGDAVHSGVVRLCFRMTIAYLGLFWP